MTALATSMLERNLRALSRGSPDLARRLAEVPPRDDVRFIETDEGVLSAEIGEGQSRRALASRRRPREEGRALAATVGIADAAVFIISGFGAGYHVEALATRLNKTGVVVVFEPDLGLLRAVLERIDCSAWLGAKNVAIVDNPDDTGALARLVEGVEAMVAMGVTLVEHPASRARIGDATRRLHANFLDVVKAVKMTVVTTMVQVKTTLRNLTQNLDRYCDSPGVGEIAGACRGRAAIVVSAGPSLECNIGLLEQPWVRERFAIIAVQTVLKPLLKRGIRPHFVTALDYSEISTRFYEGLTPEDVKGITLVADAKVNPAVLDAWCRLGGALRIQTDKYLDKLLGKEITRDKGQLPPGATVAHLAYYLARHLGCDPVALIGQDLGFTDGQYYAAGAAIHNLWACELNEFNTLEMLEWQRILRMGEHLRKATDVLGRSIYTDQQMATYLVQFERDFRADAERGLTTIDATEGGVRKQHTRVRTLGEFLEGYRERGGAETIDELLRAAASRSVTSAGSSLDAKRLEERIGVIRNDAARIAESSRRAESLLAEMIEHHADQARVNRLIGKLEKVRDEAVTRQPAFDLTQSLNQTGVFNRLRADRALQVESNAGGMNPTERQGRQLERDRENVRMLALAAADLGAMMGDCVDMLRTGRRVTRAQDRIGDETSEPVAEAVVATVIPVFADQTHLAEVVCDGLNALELTVARLTSRDGATSRIFILTDDPAHVATILKHRPPNCTIEIIQAPPGFSTSPRRAAVRAARALARECWRGGIADQSIYDEVFDPAPLRDLARARNLDAILLVGPDWCAVDPALCDAVVDRFRRNPGHSRFTFTQAAPGLCGCVLSRSLLEDFADGESRSGVFASIGGLLGYIPFTPIVDLINLPECVAVDPALRDVGERVIADTPRGRGRVAESLARTGHAPRSGGFDSEGRSAPVAPTHLVLHICSGPGAVRRSLTLAHARAAIARLDPEERPVVTVRSADPDSTADPLDHPELSAIIDAARERGATVHLRTPLTSARIEPGSLVEGAIAIISCDLHSDLARSRFDELIAARQAQALAGKPPVPPAWALPWIVPRITRCDAQYEQIDGFFRPRVIQCGWAVIDAAESPSAGERIQPLPVPEHARTRRARATLTIGVDGAEIAG